jgi:transposase
MDGSSAQGRQHPDYGATRRREQEPSTPSIEQVFAKLKTLLRKAAERTVEATWMRIGALLDCFTPQECANYIANAGCAST